ncbi:transporter substrate-binding domain-containing protein [Legionella worsleiensis]|uniref:Glutamine ABC transporter n=1 Tax=Legionella worsleiensis TaxID=45076 RepID=A0A0W1ALB9_9GAMM|nr:transporter substrate-binding domain-containing protein [Legionella worsleiensis]KTD82132.1 glutamine ABC transporter [Legionella worsleiensis]STY31404.1 glutamine ABC transporter [Legionella worsleiensis]
MKWCLALVLLCGSLLAHSVPITVGVTEYAPPLSTSIDGGKSFYGFHIDLMTALCKRMKMNCLYKAVKLTEQVQALNQGTVDVIFSITPIEQTITGNYVYSLPYINSDAQFVALLSNNKINNINDINNVSIGVFANTLYHSFINTQYSATNTVKVYSSIADMVSALASKDVDVLIFNNNIARYIIYNDSNRLKLVGSPIPLGNGYGLLALKKNIWLINRINTALLQIESDGTYLAIYKPYFGNEMY